MDWQEPEPNLNDQTHSDLGFDQLFEVLKNQRRRYVLEYLRVAEEKVTLSDLSEQIAAWENDKEVEQITSSERKRVYVGLYQVHLPKMDGMGVVSFNKPRATIEEGKNADNLYPYLDSKGEHDDRQWPKYYFGLSAAFLFGLGGAVLVEGLVALPVVAFVAVVSLVAFLAVSITHYRSQIGGDDPSRQGDGGSSV